MPENVFSKYLEVAWPYKFSGRLQFNNQVRGGAPTDPNVAEGWIRSKVEEPDAIIQDMVAEAMKARGVDLATMSEDDRKKAIEDVKKNRHLNGFKKDDKGLYLEGRQLKAAIKEAAMVCVAADKIKGTGWGKTNKALKGFIAEHVMVVEDKLHLIDSSGRNITEPTGVDQKFIHTWRASSISYEEFVEGAYLDFTVITDYPFDEQDFAVLWLTGGEQGLGATRSQGYGRYSITRWEATH